MSLVVILIVLINIWQHFDKMTIIRPNSNCKAIFLIDSVGYPIGHTAVIGLFSKSEYKKVRIVTAWQIMFPAKEPIHLARASKLRAIFRGSPALENYVAQKKCSI